MSEPVRRLNDQQRFNWLRLIRTERIGPVTFRQLIQRFGSAQAAIEGLPQLAAKGGAHKGIRLASESDIFNELEAAKKIGVVFIAMGEPEYPSALRHLENSPPMIAVLGDISALKQNCIGVVGSRSASTNGLAFARRMAADLSSAGYAVASGLARGIDRAAHEGAVTNGGTVAVLAGGLDRPYPPQNLDLYDRIRQSAGSCLISAMPLGYEPVARDFPRRNAIIAGLSIAVVVVEAAERSGSLITAKMATEAGRLVFAVPGHPVDPRSAGTNGLIREGAELARSASDVIELVQPMTLAPVQKAEPALSELFSDPKTRDAPAPQTRAINPNRLQNETQRQSKDIDLSKNLNLPENLDLPEHLFSLLGPSPTSVDDLVRESQVSASKVQAALLELELAGRIERGAGGVVSAII